MADHDDDHLHELTRQMPTPRAYRAEDGSPIYDNGANFSPTETVAMAAGKAR